MFALCNFTQDAKKYYQYNISREKTHVYALDNETRRKAGILVILNTIQLHIFWAKKKMKNLLQLAFLYGEGIRNLDFGEGFLSEIIKGIW